MKLENLKCDTKFNILQIFQILLAMSLCPPGEDPGTRYGDDRLNQMARKEGGPETDVFIVTEETGTLNIRCKVCEMTIFGVRNLNSHIAGKKHQGKFSSKVCQIPLI